jgi:hypothetical protein
MRMDKESNFSAYDVVNKYSIDDLTRIIRDYGEEKFASSIAHNIVKERAYKPIETTFELVEIISKSMPMKAKRDKYPVVLSARIVHLSFCARKYPAEIFTEFQSNTSFHLCPMFCPMCLTLPVRPSHFAVRN